MLKEGLNLLSTPMVDPARAHIATEFVLRVTTNFACTSLSPLFILAPPLHNDGDGFESNRTKITQASANHYLTSNQAYAPNDKH